MGRRAQMSKFCPLRMFTWTHFACRLFTGDQPLTIAGLDTCLTASRLGVKAKWKEFRMVGVCGLEGYGARRHALRLKSALAGNARVCIMNA